MTGMSKVVLTTGASAGIGKERANCLLINKEKK
jgi:NADP-dependent 3-hydroxy acid dehydrogenase YdfG